ncbi:Glycerol-3-phosphate/dihydroxyacetone phosphate acyltransferase [Zalaria obscura]|uniref:Glycerol-3-phosphate/dihydroxyacetone phosphate acyltransferase n=1 Tax=Zalaria obscura TaxID=2024903 RepID=A0ACC3SMW1_9PEZI
MVVVSFAGLRYGEIGVDILRSLPPLVMALSPSSSAELVSLRSQRRALVRKVVQVINTFGPEIYPSFENEKLMSRHLIDDSGSEDDALYGGYATYTAGLKSISEHDRGKTNDADKSIIHETIVASDKKTTSQGKDTLRMRGRERKF